MAKTNVEEYINELRGLSSEAKDLDLYSLKKELCDLNEHSNIFENFEKESQTIDKNALEQISNLNYLIKIRRLASEIKNKKQINDKLHSLHFNLNLLKNASDAKTVRNAINLFLYNNETKIDTIIDELNDFRTKLDKIKNYHSNLLPKSLDNKLEIENKYNKHVEQLHSIHKRQKDALISIVKLFLKLTKKHIKTYKNLKIRSKN